MDQEMKISSDVVRRLRHERGWSQEQLSAAAGLSLRTVQRVEGEGVASRETRVCLAATFGIELGALSEESAPDSTRAVATPVVLVGYKAAAWVSVLAVIFTVLCVVFPGMLPGGVTAAAGVIAIQTAVYGVFGWIFQGSASRSTPGRRAVQRGLVYLVIFCLFVPISGPGRPYLVLVAQLGLVACAIYLVASRYFSKVRGRTETLRVDAP